jgi:hypothetical protein
MMIRGSTYRGQKLIIHGSLLFVGRNGGAQTILATGVPEPERLSPIG